MSLPSVARDKITNKVSLVTRPSVTLVQTATGTSASQPQPKLIYSTSYNVVQQPNQSQSSQQQQQQQPHHQQQQLPSYFSTTSTNKPKPLSQQISIISSKTIRPPTVNKVIQLPSATTISSAAANRVQNPIAQTPPPPQQVAVTTATASAASAPNRVQTIQTIHFKSNVPSAPIHHKTTTVNSRPILNDRSPAIVPVTANTRLDLPSQSSTSSSAASASTSVTGATTIKRHETIIQKLHPTSNASSNHKTNANTVNVVKVDPVKNRYRTILENLLQLKVYTSFCALDL